LTDVSLLENQLQQLVPDDRHIDDHSALRCCQLALASIREGSYGIGAVLVEKDGQVLAEGRNAVFTEGFLSSAHAEMQCLDQFELAHPQATNRKELTLIVSLEPCPMCLSRTLLSGIGQVKYLVADSEGGMAKRINKLPPAFRNLATVQDYQQADISAPVQSMAQQLANFGKTEFRRRWRELTGH
jgi:tRNA(adenine34) deaminase